MYEIELFHHAARKTANKELRLIREEIKSTEMNNVPEILSSSFYNITFRDAETGNHLSCAQSKASVKQRYLNAYLHKNKQYQWLLSEAYEEYEDFIEGAYAYCGMKDISFWPLRDYGHITFSELKTKDFTWHVAKSRHKKDKPHSILSQFRNKFTNLVEIEKNNKLQVNLKLAVTLIEQLRHIIVHNGGKVASRSNFVDSVTRKCGLYNNGKPKDDHVKFIEQFFGENEYDNMVTIVEIPTHISGPIERHISRIEVLLEYLLAHAHLIFKCIDSEAKGSKITSPDG
jgi:hypothetical protein